ncbi:MAG: hypothetical protein Q7T41_04155 [Candidatus Saccharibacteria bacterium]|nr:hypothetical protein [Candidatus Saccharibacteria bacterium]
MYKINRHDFAKPPSDIDNYFLAKLDKERKLEEIALERLEARRFQLRLKPSDILPKNVFIEALSSGHILYQHGVRYRRARNDPEMYDTELENFLNRIADLGNFGICPTAKERREILHPPFESFTALKNTEVSSAVGEVVTQLVVNASEVLRPDGLDAEIIQFPTPNLEEATVVEATA